MSEDMFSKKCDNCGTNAAMLYFRSFQNDKFIEEGLCPRCALQRFSSDETEMGIPSSEIIKTINEMRHILSDIVGKISQQEQIQATQENKKNTHFCSQCHTSLQYIQKTRLAGCPSCYNIYQDALYEIISANSFSTKHHGQIPSRHKSSYLQNLELDKLRLKLQNLVRQESYEEAAKISKRIAKLESKTIKY